MFLYVNSTEDKEKLIKLGYKLLYTKNEKGNQIYVFEDNNKMNFSDTDIKVYRSNKLYF